MNAIDILIYLIKKYEGCKLTAYRCPAGIWTIGYGCTGKDIIEGITWTQKQADENLIRYCEHYISSALAASPILKSQSQYKIAAIADFIYNEGIGHYIKSTLKTYVDSANWLKAQEEILKWNKGGGKILPGLVTRRKEESFDLNL